MRTYAAVMPAGRFSMGGLVRSEWMKFRTVSCLCVATPSGQCSTARGEGTASRLGRPELGRVGVDASQG